MPHSFSNEPVALENIAKKNIGKCTTRRTLSSKQWMEATTTRPGFCNPGPLDDLSAPDGWPHLSE
jgi:hypothetical protein